MQHWKTLLFTALLPFALAPAIAIAAEGDYGQQESAQQPGAQPGAAQRPGAQPGEADRPGAAERDPAFGAERDHHEGARPTGQAAIIERQDQDTFLASDELIGQEVRNQQDEEIGTISDLLLDRDGNVKGLVVGVGGFLGVGERDVAIQWDAVELTMEEDEAYVRIDMDRDTLEQAPEFRLRDDEDDAAGTW